MNRTFTLCFSLYPIALPFGYVLIYTFYHYAVPDANSNLTDKFDKSGGVFSGDINLANHKLNFTKGGTLGFYIYKDDSGKLGVYNHDNLLLAYFDFGGGLHMRRDIVRDIT